MNIFLSITGIQIKDIEHMKHIGIILIWQEKLSLIARIVVGQHSYTAFELGV